MRLVTCAFKTKYQHEVYQAGKRYVCPDPDAGEWFRAAPDAVRVSSVRSWERPYFGHDLTDRSLWVSHGCGMGDALVMTGVLAEIKRRWPSSRLTFSTRKAARRLCGAGEPDSEVDKVFQFGSDVLPFDEWAAFDWHKIVEEIIELDREPDQTDIWTTHFRFFGLGPVEPVRCRPLNIVTGKARSCAHDWLSRLAITKPVLLYQIGATSPARSQSWGRVAATADTLAERFPDMQVVLVGGKESAAFQTVPRVARLIGEDPLIMVGLCALSRVIVGPDSCINHIAAGLGEASPPVVSLWSSFDPAARVATYPHQFPIYNRLPCSPCFHHEFGPVEGCPMYRGHCHGLEAITPAQICNRVAEALESTP